jgi:hypothetical protein
MGSPLTREGIIEWTNEIIDDTVHSHRLAEFKMKGNQKNDRSVGVSWYHGFLKRHSNYLNRIKCKILDQNRINWCTYQNFTNMYDGVYSAIVNAGVAVCTPENQMYRV